MVSWCGRLTLDKYEPLAEINWSDPVGPRLARMTQVIGQQGRSLSKELVSSILHHIMPQPHHNMSALLIGLMTHQIFFAKF